MDAHDGDDDRQYKVERDEEAVESASGACEICVEDPGEGYSERIHSCCRPYEDPLPEVGGGR